MTPGKFLFITSVIYLIVGLLDVCFKFCPIEIIQAIWIIILMAAIFINPFGWKMR